MDFGGGRLHRYIFSVHTEEFRPNDGGEARGLDGEPPGG